MNKDTGDIRVLEDLADLNPNEVPFIVGEQLEIKGCQFVIQHIETSPANIVVLRGMSKEGQLKKQKVELAGTPFFKRLLKKGEKL